jgi:hypothetical protein
MGETDIFDREAKGVLQIRVARTCSFKGSCTRAWASGRASPDKEFDDEEE